MSSRRARAAAPGGAAGGEASEAVSVLTLDLRLCALENLRLGDQHQVETGECLEPAEALPQNTLGPIPGHRASHLAGRRQTQPAVSTSVRGRDHQEERAVETDSLPKG